MICPFALAIIKKKLHTDLSTIGIISVCIFIGLQSGGNVMRIEAS